MPWNVGQKIYIRDNGEFQGSEVWDDDATADENVDANRHDTHDQDIAGGISACLNKDGINEMGADLKMATHKIVGLLPGTVATDAINKSQSDAIEVKADAAQTDADTALAATVVNASDIADLQALGTTAPYPIDDLRSLGGIRHASVIQSAGGPVTIDSSEQGRYTVLNNGASLSITITRPTGADADLGENYEVEGSLLVVNDASPSGAITIAGVSAADILGEPNLDASGRSLLSWVIHRRSGDSYTELYIWSA